MLERAKKTPEGTRIPGQGRNTRKVLSGDGSFISGFRALKEKGEGKTEKADREKSLGHAKHFVLHWELNRKIFRDLVECSGMIRS